MKTLKVLLQEVVSGIKAWVNSNFAQESNTVHKTGNETVNGIKTFSESKIGLGAASFAREQKGSTTYEMTASEFYNKLGFFKITQFKAGSTSAPRGNNGDYDLIGMSPNAGYGTYLCTTPRNDLLWYGKFWDSVWQGWKEVVNCESTQTITGEKIFQRYVSVYSNTLNYGTIPSENAYCTFGFKDSGGITTARLLRWVNHDGYNGLTMQCWDSQATTETAVYFQLAYDTQGNGYAKFGGFGGNTVGFIPVTDNSVGLGTSTNRWKTLNGLNPGVLSLPDLSDPDPINTSTWVTDTPTNNAYTPSEDGWLNVVTSHATSSLFSVYIKSGDFYVSTYSALEDIDDNTYKSGLFIPVLAGQTYYIVFKGGLSNITVDATFYPAKGNV